MRIVLQNFAQVLNKQISKLVLSFAQYIFMLAPTKSDYFYNAILSGLIVLKRLSFFLQTIYFLNLHLAFFAVKSLEANLAINSQEAI